MVQKECIEKKKKLEKQLAELKVWEDKLKKQDIADEKAESQKKRRGREVYICLNFFREFFWIKFF